MTLVLASIDGSQVLLFMFWVIVAALMFWIANWFINYSKLSDPFAMVLRVTIGLLAAAVLISQILVLCGKSPLIKW